MTALRTLLSATDLSAPSRHAVLRAALLARECGARLELLHVLEGNALSQLRQLLGPQAEAWLPRLTEETRARLARLAADVCTPLRVSPGVHLATGTVLPTIAAEAERMDADLLVLGARGAGFMRHLLLGATAERMLGVSTRPLLIVKQVPHEPYRRVLLSLDFSPYAARVLALARRVAPQAHWVLLHAYEVPLEGQLRLAGVDEETVRQYRGTAEREATRALHEAARQVGLAPERYEVLTLHGDAAPHILEQEEELDADLIVIGKHGQGVAEELLLGSVTKHVLAEARGDVLVAR